MQYPTSSPNAADYYITVNGDISVGPGCAYNELIINVFDPISFQANAKHYRISLYGSGALLWLFTITGNLILFSLGDTASRRKAREFLENIVPEGAYVAIRSNTCALSRSKYIRISMESRYCLLWTGYFFISYFEKPGIYIYRSL